MSLASPRRRSLGLLPDVRPVACACVLAWASACSSSTSTASGTANPADVQSTGGSLHFQTADVLTASPASTVSVLIDVDVDGPVSLWLDGAYADGSLQASTVTATDGVAVASLRTPSLETTFRLHAKSSSGQVAELAVAVSASGFVSLGIHTTYSGVRASSSVVASAFVNTTCQALTASGLMDGSPSVSGSVGASLALEDVPAGAPVSVLARIGHYAVGCIDAGVLASGQAQDLAVPIYDVPLALAETNLDVVLTWALSPSEAAYWSGILDRGRSRADASFFESSSDAGALLDAMQALVPSASAGAFQAARSAKGWDASTGTWLQAHAPSLRNRVDTYLEAAETRARGPLELAVAQANAGVATITPRTVSGVPASAAGWLAPAPFAWTADAHDVVHLAGAFFVQTSAMLTALSSTGTFPPLAAAVPTALAGSEGIDCSGLGSALAAGGTSYSTCDVACTTALCSAALASMWARAGSSSLLAGDITQVAVIVSGQATVGDAAQPVGLVGNWVSQVSASTGNGSLDGTVSATTR